MRSKTWHIGRGRSDYNEEWNLRSSRRDEYVHPGAFGRGNQQRQGQIWKKMTGSSETEAAADGGRDETCGGPAVQDIWYQ